MNALALVLRAQMAVDALAGINPANYSTTDAYNEAQAAVLVNFKDVLMVGSTPEQALGNALDVYKREIQEIGADGKTGKAAEVERAEIALEISALKASPGAVMNAFCSITEAIFRNTPPPELKDLWQHGKTPQVTIIIESITASANDAKNDVSNLPPGTHLITATDINQNPRIAMSQLAQAADEVVPDGAIRGGLLAFAANVSGVFHPHSKNNASFRDKLNIFGFIDEDKQLLRYASLQESMAHGYHFLQHLREHDPELGAQINQAVATGNSAQIGLILNRLALGDQSTATDNAVAAAGRAYSELGLTAPGNRMHATLSPNEFSYAGGEHPQSQQLRVLAGGVIEAAQIQAPTLAQNTIRRKPDMFDLADPTTSAG